MLVSGRFVDVIFSSTKIADQPKLSSKFWRFFHQGCWMASRLLQRFYLFATSSGAPEGTEYHWPLAKKDKEPLYPP